MAQHDYVIDNSTGANVRADINSVLQAIASNNSGSSAPSATFASQFFADTNAGIMKLRNTSNNNYVNLFTLAGGIDVDAASDFNADVTFTGASANITFQKTENRLKFADNAKASFGGNADLTITHDGSNSIINDSGTGELQLQRAGNTMLTLSQTGIKVTDPNGQAEVQIEGFEGSDAAVQLIADQGDDNGDKWKLESVASDNNLRFQNNISGSYATKWSIDTDGDVTFTGQIFAPNGSAANPSYSFTNTTNMGFFRNSTNQIGVSIDGTGEYRFTTAQFGPLQDDANDLGTASFRFDDVFATNGTINTSDQNLKNTIATSDLGLDFINKLNPVSYKFNGKTRTHYGLIAQEIETVLSAISKPATDFAGFCKDEVDDDGNAMTAKYGLRYTEFIAPIVKAIQELSVKVAALEAA